MYTKDVTIAPFCQCTENRFWSKSQECLPIRGDKATLTGRVLSFYRDCPLSVKSRGWAKRAGGGSSTMKSPTQWRSMSLSFPRFVIQLTYWNSEKWVVTWSIIIHKVRYVFLPDQDSVCGILPDFFFLFFNPKNSLPRQCPQVNVGSWPFPATISSFSSSNYRQL